MIDPRHPCAPPRQVAPRSALGLTARQSQVLKYMLDGKSNKHIANALSLSPSTVKVHGMTLLRAFNVHTRLQLSAAVADRLGVARLSTLVGKPRTTARHHRRSVP